MGKNKNITKAALIFIGAAFFMSCGSNHTSEEIVKHNRLSDSLSVEVADSVKITYTDSAVLRAEIEAPEMKRFPDEENPRLEMPKGVKATFFNDISEVTSTLTARYAIHHEKEDRIEIRDSAVVLNKNDEEIRTDELIWDKKNRTVTSDKPVRVRIRDEKIIKAQGFESDEDFLNYKFTKVTGIVYLNETAEE